MRKGLTLVALVIACCGLQLNAQNTSTDTTVSIRAKASGYQQSAGGDYKKNFVKLNLTGLVLKNFTFQYERVLKRRMSAALSVRFMPYSSLPLKGTIQNALGNEDGESYKIVDRFKVSNFAITPEMRFYLGKGYGKGFYIAPFYRFASFKSDDLTIFYQDANNSSISHQINFKGKLTGNTAGFALGAQWFLGKRICLDWTILGPHFGGSSGSFTGVSDVPISDENKAEIQKKIDDLNIPLTKTTVEFEGANTARMNFSGPWGGLRFGLSIGVKF